MDALFICKFKPTEEIIVEASKALKKNKVIIENTVILIFCLTSSLTLWITTKLPESFLFAAIGIFYIVSSILMDRYTEKKKAEQSLKSSSNTLSTFLFYDNNIATEDETTTTSKSIINYSSIIKVAQTQNLYLLFLGKKSFVLIDKNRFEKGTCKEFEEFIKAKAVNAKIKL